MEKTPLSFDQLPAYVFALGRKVDDLTEMLAAIAVQQNPRPDRWFSIEELCDYLPGRPAVTTIYGKVQRREIPFSRNGKRLAFSQSTIDLWLQSQRVKTAAELSQQADAYVVSSRKGGRKSV